MPVIVERGNTRWRIRLEGEVNLGSAPQLKKVLLEWLAASVDLELDIEDAQEVDFAALQLLWAAFAEAAAHGLNVAARWSQPVSDTIRQTGFDSMPGCGNAAY